MRRRSIAMIGALAAVAIPLAATSAEAAGSEGNAGVRNVNSNKCLAVAWANRFTSGSPAHQYTCDKASDGSWGKNQVWIWTLVDGAEATYFLELYDTGRCLAIGGASHVKGAEAVIWSCGGADGRISNSPEQQWIYDSDHRLRNKESGLCLAIPDGSKTNDVTAIQWTCRDVSTNPEQKWNQEIVG